MRVQPRTFRSITDLLLAPHHELLVFSQVPTSSLNGRFRQPIECPTTPLTDELTKGTAGTLPYNGQLRRLFEGRDLARYRNQPDKSPHQPITAMHHRPKNQERAPICQSLPCSDLVSFPVLSQIKPHIPRLVVSFRQFL